MAAAAHNARREQRSISAFRRPRRLLQALAMIVPCMALASPSYGATPDSPEVQAMVEKGLKYLEDHPHGSVGGDCLIGLAYYKHGAPKDHPKIKAAVEACRTGLAREAEQINYIYGKALAIIFLSEVDAQAHRELIGSYLNLFKAHQKKHGGFTYHNSITGDTSQTQYAALAYWSMLNHGISPDPASVQDALNWLMRTRDPSGVWGYQGTDPGSFTLVAQQDKPGVSMSAAGLSGVMILGNMLGLLKAPEEEAAAEQAEDLPAALRRAEVEKVRKAPTLPPGNVDPQRLNETLQAGRAWYDKNFKLDVHEYQSYYLYSIERCRSFQEYLDGDAPEEPDWYNAGVELLKKTQDANGSWNDEAGVECATAFSILFLLRSTQKSIAARLGEGTLVGGRGLPRDLSKVKIRGGRLVVEQQPTEVDELLGMLDDGTGESFDALMDDPAALQVADVAPDQARRLQQVARSGPAGARLLAVRALGKLRSLDHAPTLIFALTDPDKRVVREARDGLRSISRNFEGFGPPDNFDDPQREQAVQRWKEWYRTVRPDAPPLP